jgi:hypothetical protein
MKNGNENDFRQESKESGTLRRKYHTPYSTKHPCQWILAASD